MTVLPAALLQPAAADWTLTAALCTAITVLSGVIVTLWLAYTRERNKYETLLKTDRDELVPQMLQLAERASTLNANAEKLLAETIRLRSQRTSRGRGGGSDDGTDA